MSNYQNKENQLPKNGRGKSFGKKAHFAIITLVLSAVAFLFVFENYGSYRSEISIIFLPKSGKAAADSEHIIENLRVLPEKLSFYDKLLRDNENLIDPYSGSSESRRKNYWNKTIGTKREGESSIIKITASAASPEEAMIISKAATRTLFNIMSFYYNIKSDIDLRIVEGPTVRTGYENLFLLVILSLSLGTAASLLIDSFSKVISDYFSKEDTGKRISFPKHNFEKELEKKIELGDYFKEFGKKWGAKEKKSVSNPEITAKAKTASAPKNLPGVPENLPFIDEDYFRNNIIKGAKQLRKEGPTEESQKIPEKITPAGEASSENTEGITPDDIHREPTKEELKKRLNQLLRGEL